MDNNNFKTPFTVEGSLIAFNGFLSETQFQYYLALGYVSWESYHDDDCNPYTQSMVDNTLILVHVNGLDLIEEVAPRLGQPIAISLTNVRFNAAQKPQVS